MKKSEWNRRLPLDREGVRILGAALHLRARARERQLAERIERRRASDIGSHHLNGLRWPQSIDRDIDALAKWTRHREVLQEQIEILGITEKEYLRAKTIRAKDFRFRWDNLMEHRTLLGYISDDVPDWALSWDRATPISERWHDTLTEALEALFGSEFDRLEGPEPDDVPYLREPEEFLFHLSVWKLCELERGRGQPQGRRWQDGLDNAASYAWSLRHEAAAQGKPISNEEAIRRALEKFTIIGSQGFAEFRDKASAIVSDAASPGGRTEGAIKAVRKRLREIDKSEDGSG